MRKIAFLVTFFGIPLAAHAGQGALVIEASDPFATCTFGVVPKVVVVQPQVVVHRQPQVIVVQAQRQRPRRPQPKPSLIRRVLKRVF